MLRVYHPRKVWQEPMLLDCPQRMPALQTCMPFAASHCVHILCGIPAAANASRGRGAHVHRSLHDTCPRKSMLISLVSFLICNLATVPLRNVYLHHLLNHTVAAADVQCHYFARVHCLLRGFAGRKLKDLLQVI